MVFLKSNISFEFIFLNYNTDHSANKYIRRYFFGNMEWDLKSSVLDSDRSKKIQDQHLDPYRSRVQDQHLDPYRSRVQDDLHLSDPYRSRIQDDQHLSDPYRSKIQDDDQHLDPSMWDLKSSVLDPDQSKIQDHLDPSMFIQCYSVPTGRVSTLMIRPPSSNSSSLDIDTEVAEINNNISRR